MEERQEKAKKKKKRAEVVEGDFEKMEHGRLLCAVLYPSP